MALMWLRSLREKVIQKRARNPAPGTQAQVQGGRERGAREGRRPSRRRRQLALSCKEDALGGG